MRFGVIGERGLVVTLALLLAGWGTGQSAASPGEGDSALSERCEYGIILALDGQSASAESVLTEMLAAAPGDSRALNNLGNLHFLRDDVGGALAFYIMAEGADSLDAGILINRALAYLILGDEERALRAARQGIHRAGDLPAAASLIGIAYPPRSADSAKTRRGKVRLNREEVLALLSAAAEKSPKDTTATNRPPAKPPDSGPTKPRPVWRSAGARAGDDWREVAERLYWKH
jgi:tetratricopeptide (TPR) repeat protein